MIRPGATFEKDLSLLFINIETHLGGFPCALARRDSRAELTGRLTKDTFESAVELRERLKSDVVGDFTDAQVRVEKPGPGIFQAHTGYVIGELQAGGFVENFAEMKYTRTRRLRHIS